ncbi:MAG: SusC/RagA family TonB-linked outer membrane protein [Bacteroidales bacterium]|jgi:TonB-linked SusC/RagA family outer membrane protein|nr:SusC/RagA family TonB-linked outer membrane protein [Bacteroidales bacterium]
MKKIVTFILLSLFTFAAFAQNTVTGSVKDAVTGEPLIGVGVIVSTGGGAVTDVDGSFSVNAGKDATLTFNLLGYADVVEPVNGRSKLEVFMKEDVHFLDEVVVMGYTTQKKNELSSSVVSLRSEELLDNSTPDLGNMIQGKAAGVVVMNASGMPGEAAQIRIRGTGSISASADPLYVVDGIAGGTFNPNDVESVTILKDASATALYGASAAGGVIVVTTKSAKDRSRTDVNFKASAGIKQSLSGRYRPMNSQELYETQRMMMSAKNFEAQRPESLLEQDFDWYGNIFKKGIVQDYYASVSGIAGRVNYFVSVDHYDEQGSLIGTGFDRNSARLNLSAPIGEKVTLNTRLGYNRSHSTSYSDWKDIATAYNGMPWDNPFDEEGRPLAIGMPEGEGAVWYGKEQYNPFHTLQYNNSQSWGEDLVADVQLIWNITDWLTFTSNNRLGSSTWNSKNYEDSRANTSAKNIGSLYQGSGRGWSVGLTELLKFHKNFDNHALSSIVGYEVGWGYTESIGASGINMPTGMQALNSVSATGVGVSGSDYHSAAWAVLAQAQYSYMEKYIATASIRYDKTYKFAPKARGGYFPGVSAAWIISKEPFMQGLKAFDLLKLRAGYGVTGNSDISPFLYQDSFATSNTYNDKVVAVAERMPNDYLGWESAHMASLGLDMRLVDRINITVDVYSTDNKNLLLDVPQAPSTGFSKYTTNIGTVNNKGIEFAADADILKSKDLRWNLGVNFGLNRNTVKHLPNGAFRRGFGTPMIEQIVCEGYDIYTWYMPEWAGVDPENGDPLWWEYEKETDASGNILYYVLDERGNPTAEKSVEETAWPVFTGNRETTNNYAKADYRMNGSATPKFTGGVTSNLVWRNWSLGANLHFVYGNKIYNAARNTIDSDGSYIDYNMQSIHNGLGWVRWDPEDESTHAIATHPRPTQNGNKKSNSVSTRYLEDGSFLRLKNVTLAYNINKPIFKGFIQAGRIYFTADNVLTFTKFSGADPEVRLEGTSWSLAGMFNDNYPVPRSFVFGIDLKF